MLQGVSASFLSPSLPVESPGAALFMYLFPQQYVRYITWFHPQIQTCRLMSLSVKPSLFSISRSSTADFSCFKKIDGVSRFQVCMCAGRPAMHTDFLVQIHRVEQQRYLHACLLHTWTLAELFILRWPGSDLVGHLCAHYDITSPSAETFNPKRESGVNLGRKRIVYVWACL